MLMKPTGSEGIRYTRYLHHQHQGYHMFVSKRLCVKKLKTSGCRKTSLSWTTTVISAGRTRVAWLAWLPFLDSKVSTRTMKSKTASPLPTLSPLSPHSSFPTNTVKETLDAMPFSSHPSLMVPNGRCQQSQTDDRVLEKQLSYLDDMQLSISIGKETCGSSLYFVKRGFCDNVSILTFHRQVGRMACGHCHFAHYVGFRRI
ncbi:hypothetical protein B0T13DRAFT_235865 [Neurospora crassa]|nr:hypothetical protein B0T13DRAFT_235865 [Neurospora crassa]